MERDSFGFLLGTPPPLPVIPPGSQAILLDKDNKAINRGGCRNKGSAAASPPISGPSYFQLLETVSPHVQSVMLDRCAVMELSSLAAVSRSLREGALATMAKRSLNIAVGRSLRLLKDGMPMDVVVMFIDDISDPSRNMSVEFCNCLEKRDCLAWPKVKKLLLFCGHASVKWVQFGLENSDETTNFTNRYAMKSDHSAKPKSHGGELFVDEFSSHFSECNMLLQYVFPRDLQLGIKNDYCGMSDCFSDAGDFVDISGPDFVPGKLKALFNGRAMLSAENILINFQSREEYPVITDELMLKLRASLIILFTVSDPIHFDMVRYIKWSPVGVSQFIEQWLQGSRIINKVVSRLYMPEKISVNLFHKMLLRALEKLDPPPQVVSSTTLDDDLKGRLQISRNGKMIYRLNFGFNSDEAAVIHVTAPGGRKLTIAVTGGWDIQEKRRSKTGFIDIFPST